MAYYIGVDGGGTKTELAAVGEDGRTLCRAAGASTNPHAVGEGAAVRELVSLMETIAGADGVRGLRVGGICLGLSGVASDAEEAPFRGAVAGFLQRIGASHAPVSFLSEAEISLMAALGRAHGLLAVSGTGSIVYGVEPDGTRRRAGGWGHLLGDEGSGYAIGVRTLKAAMAAYDGAVGSTDIVPSILRSYAFKDITELKAYIYGPSIAKADIAAFARIAIDACERGDAVAAEIVRGEASALAATAAALLDRHPRFAAEEMAFAGSVFRSSKTFRDAFRRSLAARYPELRFAAEPSGRTPAEGAALLARTLHSSSHVRGNAIMNTMSSSSSSSHELLNRLITEQVNERTTRIDELDSESIMLLINDEDRKVADSVRAIIPSVALAADWIVDAFRAGGRLFYVGAGTSGRIGILDASECPPTYGTDPSLVQGIIAGGFQAVRDPIEGAEDSAETGAADIDAHGVRAGDVVVGIAASGRTPYVLGAMRRARDIGARVVGLSNNPGTPMADCADLMLEAVVGPEAIQGSTRMKAGTAQKMILNLLTTTAFVRSGKVYGNLMVDLNPSNEKLVHRAKRIIAQATGADDERVAKAFEAAGRHVKTAIVMLLADVEAPRAQALLLEADGFVRRALELSRNA